MKILLIGNGGRENAMAWKIINSQSFIDSNSVLFCTTGNPGINEFAEPVNLKPTQISELTEFCSQNEIGLTIVGPEIPLALGIVNEFEKKGLRIFGPGREAAEIESSKVFSKELMIEYNIPTAKFKKFSRDSISDAEEFFENCSYPVVIKADGLAAGKGVIIAEDKHVAISTLIDFTEKEIFGESGFNFIAEEYLEGEEVSVFVITDGDDYVVLPYSQDHKKIGEGDTGNNTGGMGAVAPVKKFMNDELQGKIRERIIGPVLKALKDKKRKFKGCLYCGLMIKDNEPFVIEYNCRFGDPETQAVLPLIRSDFLELLTASADNKIGNYKLEIFDKYACCVVMSSGGYPGDYETGKPITGTVNDINDHENVLVFHSGTKRSDEGGIITNGGRVLSVTGVSDESLKNAVENAYKKVSEIDFENKYFRKDIGSKLVD
ncbi:MAG TPA: phosphoribosylamine--glycine ligase [Ignavibacteria bacterium]|nr:phosphoribosylamine--glycine ligase [Ignavibacteria bacterium]HMR41862.1 phosphoribosylamine--glycine ligase [Ignavibacteria bacterium]